MIANSYGVRFCAFLLVISLIVAYGCALPLPPPDSYVSKSGEVPDDGFKTVPLILTDEEHIRFVSPSLAEREVFEKRREEFDKDRQQRIKYRKESKLSGRNSLGGMTTECVVRTLIFAPICIVLVPVTYGIASTVEGIKASSNEPYLPALPSTWELSRIHDKIKQQLTAAAIAKQIMGDLSGKALSDDRFPRILIRAESATFTVDRMVCIKIVVQGQPMEGVSWTPTEHLYYIGYTEGYVDNADLFGSALTQAKASLAQSISSMYGFKQQVSAVLID